VSATPDAEAPRGARARLADLPARIAFALPAAAIAVAIVAIGGVAFAAVAGAIGVLALLEAYRLLGVPTRVAAVGAVALAGLVAAVLLEGRAALAPALAASVLLVFAVAARVHPGERRRTATIAVAVLGLVWIGFGAGHAVLIRELPHGGGLMLDVLLAVFVGDTAAHLLGSLYGRRRLAPTISPNKTVEGLAAGILAGVAAAVIAAAVGQPWLELGDAALIGLAAALAAPVGDLFESLVKRDAGVKDSGALLGPHGGILDRVDAVLFAAVAAFYVAVALL
jgi:phosphatidate cytidylyltransferase